MVVYFLKWKHVLTKISKKNMKIQKDGGIPGSEAPIASSLMYLSMSRLRISQSRKSKRKDKLY
jgi:hypothetical protein